MVNLMLKHNRQKIIPFDMYRVSVPVQSFHDHRSKTLHVRPEVRDTQASLVFRENRAFSYNFV